MDKPWLVYDEWAKVYGDMIFFQVLGQPFLVLNSQQRTRDLFEKRSSNYSDRMRMPMVIELMGWDYDLGFLPYGQWCRRGRRTFYEHFNPTAVTQYHGVQTREVKALLQRLLKSPEDFRHHIRYTLASMIMSVAYGITIKESGDPFISNVEIAMAGVAEAGIPGRFWVDLMPFLKRIPAWLPGAGFQRKAAHWRSVNNEITNKPFEYVKQAIADGTAGPSLAATLLERLPKENDPARAEEEVIAKNTAAVAYVGGANAVSSLDEYTQTIEVERTLQTISATQCFFLAIAMHPEVQKMAQSEIDSVVGSGRLPGFEDRPSLPYINALIKESMRWQSIFPLAVGHMASADDEYNGYFIPKGTVVMGNAWAILHDPEVYPDPMAFVPGRFLKDGQLNPDVPDPDAAFGFGRRIYMH